MVVVTTHRRSLFAYTTCLCRGNPAVMYTWQWQTHPTWLTCWSVVFWGMGLGHTYLSFPFVDSLQRIHAQPLHNGLRRSRSWRLLSVVLMRTTPASVPTSNIRCGRRVEHPQVLSASSCLMRLMGGNTQILRCDKTRQCTRSLEDGYLCVPHPLGYLCVPLVSHIRSYTPMACLVASSGLSIIPVR